VISALVNLEAKSPLEGEEEGDYGIKFIRAFFVINVIGVLDNFSFKNNATGSDLKK